jgi:LuxR family transcriptional regulator, activator of conjugal transfer of Ti plasmids
MKSTEQVFQEFIDAIQTAEEETAFERVGTRLARRLGFRWFAYLHLTLDLPILVSSYPSSWTSRYFDLRYQQLDPVVGRARLEHDLFCWASSASVPAGTSEQRRFFEEAMTFGIRSGITMPIRAGFGRTAAFTLATDEPTTLTERIVSESRDLVQLAGLYFHTHLTIKLKRRSAPRVTENILTQRERQCLAWAAHGKTAADIAVLIGIAPRTVVFHLENARRKLGAASIAQGVAEALRRGLLS